MPSGPEDQLNDQFWGRGVWVVLGVTGVFLVAILEWPPLQRQFGAQGLSLRHWLVVAAIGTAVVLAGIMLAGLVRGNTPADAVKYLWFSTRRIFVIVGGFALLGGGAAMLVLPGPGLLVIIAGLALLATEFVWAERALTAARRRAEQGAKAAKRFVKRS